jgi:hypothetical protein
MADDRTPEVTVAVPVLRRPRLVAEALRAFTAPRVEVLFLPDRDDRATVAELDRLGARYSFAPRALAFGVPTYASKVNHAYRVTETPFLLYAADDVRPFPRWWDEARRILRDRSIGLLATNDRRHGLVTRGLLATHGIVRRHYVEAMGSASLPGSGPVFHEGYRHWCCDAEASYVARLRDAFRYAPQVVLMHARYREDEVYRLGRSFAERDRATLRQRVPSWPT